MRGYLNVHTIVTMKRAHVTGGVNKKCEHMTQKCEHMTMKCENATKKCERMSASVNT